VLVLGGLVETASVSGEKTPPPYRRATDLDAGRLVIACLNSARLLDGWTEAFTSLYPRVEVQVEGVGSPASPAVLLLSNDALDGVLTSREPRAEDLRKVEATLGYAPTAILVAFEALGIYVHADNPLTHITLEQADAVFSATRRRLGPTDIRTWGDLGLKEAWASRTLRLYGRNAASDAWAHFRAWVLLNGEFKETVEERRSDAVSVVQGVSSDPSGMGYDALVSGAPGVRTLRVADELGTAREATEANVRGGMYPLRGKLVLYVRRPHGRAPSPALRELVRFATSGEGQEAVRNAGLVPLSGSMAAAERAEDRVGTPGRAGCRFDPNVRPTGEAGVLGAATPAVG
jgi:phosphate transport system substrate-binding protein